MATALQASDLRYEVSHFVRFTDMDFTEVARALGIRDDSLDHALRRNGMVEERRALRARTCRAGQIKHGTTRRTL